MTGKLYARSSESRRVLFLVGTNHNESGGRIVAWWCKGLRELGWHCMVAFPGDGELGRILGQYGVDCVKTNFAWPSRLWPFSFLREVRRVSRFAKDNHAAILQTSGENDYRLAREVASRTDLPVCCHICLPRERAFCEWMFRDHPPNRLYCVSDALRETQRVALRNILPEDRLRVMSNAIDVAEFCPLGHGIAMEIREELGVRPDAFCIGVACTVKPYKQCHHLPGLLAGLKAGGVDAVGVVAGVVPDKAYLDGIVAEAKRLGVADRLTFTGYWTDMPRFYSICDVLVSFSKGETFGMSVAEAMACGKAVVAYECPALKEVIGDCGVLVPMNDMKAAITTCCNLARDGGSISQLTKKARNRIVERFSIGTQVKLLAAEYEEILTEWQKK